MELALKQKITRDLESSPMMTEVFSPSQYLHLTPEKRKHISKVTIETPQLGKGGFGRIRVHYDKPIYKVK